MSSPSDPPESTTQNTNPVSSWPISNYECTLSDSSCCRDVSQLVNNAKLTVSMPYHNLQMSELCDDVDAFFAKLDAIIYESQVKASSSAIVPIMERGNLISGRRGAPINRGESLPSGDKEKDVEEASTDDECNDKECPWRIHASLLPDGVTFKIKTTNSIHTCKKLVKNPNANALWLCKKLLQDVRANPDISIRGI
ncbi:hypothetical protein Ancab_025061 [Ancistrocladus abbreviatus]